MNGPRAFVAMRSALACFVPVAGLEKPDVIYKIFQWDFSLPGLQNDTFEIVVDGDASGGPLIDKGHKEFWTPDRVSEAAAAPDARISVDEAQWTFTVVDMDRRLVAFKDLSVGKVASWKWDFGDGATSTEQHPLHAYEKPGNYVVVLDIEGPVGSSRRSKVWDVQLK